MPSWLQEAITQYSAATLSVVSDNGVVVLAAVIYFIVIPSAFTIVGWLTYQQFGRRGIAITWLVATIALISLSVIRLRAMDRLFMTTPEGPQNIVPFVAAAFAFGFGGTVAVVILRSRRSERLRGGEVFLGVLGYWMGILLSLTPILIADILRVLG